MTQPTTSFVGDIPAIYDKHLGPVIFEPYARDMAARLDCPQGGRVLELAAGTGIVTRRLITSLPADASLVVTDLNPPMLEIAQRNLSNDPRVTYEPADAQALPFEDHSFDRVVMQFGIMFLPDKVQGLREAKRVLKPGGKLLFSVWGKLFDNPYAEAAHSTVQGFFASDPPKFYETPFSWCDERVILDALTTAGFRAPKLQWVDLDTTAESAAHFSTGLVKGNPVSLELAERGTAPIEEVRAAVERALIRIGGDKPWRGRLHVLVVSASA
jgi:SAM-dependent methyltransferase